MRINARKLGALSAAAVAVGALGMLPGTAGAAFDASHDTACETSANILGRGASFQRIAQLRWGAEIITQDVGGPLTEGFGYDAFGSSECRRFQVSPNGDRRVQYEPLGSGAGRAAFGAVTNANPAANTRSLTGTQVNFGGADEAPTVDQLDNANDGNPAVSYDDARLHTIPVAQSAIAVDVRIPDGCAVLADPSTRRLSAALTEQAFRGDVGADGVADTWGDLFGANITGTGTVSGTACRSIRFSRVVRFDSSGTTFQFKRYLFQINSGTVSGSDTWSTLGNTAWPAGARATINAGRNGAGAQLDALNAEGEFGGIAYADLATSRGREYGWSLTTADRTASVNDTRDTRFWVYAQQTTGTRSQISPATNNGQAATPGARCTRVVYTDTRTGRLPASTTDSWFFVDGSPTAVDYPACALTYALAWGDTAAVNAGFNGRDPATDRSGQLTPLTQTQTRITLDYLDYVTGHSTVNFGQAKLAAVDYAPLPGNSTGTSAGRVVAGSVLDLAQRGVGTLTWNPL